jgi:hypothetical protein
MIVQFYFLSMRGAGHKTISVALMAVESVINVCLILASLHLRHSQMQIYDVAILRLEQIAKNLYNNFDEFETEMRFSCCQAVGLLLVTFSATMVHQFSWAEDWFSTFEAVYGAFFCTFITFLHLMQITNAAATVCHICKHLNIRVRKTDFFTICNY